MSAEQLPAKDPRYESWRWRIFGVTWLAYAGFYLTRKSFAIAKGEILADPNVIISRGMMGLLDTVFLLAYAIGQFVWGISGDRFGTRKVVLLGMLASIAVGFALGVSSILLLFGVFLFIQGVCQSTGWAPLTKNVSYWFSRKERGRAYGWWCTNYAIGGLVASAIAGYAANYFANWRFAFFVPAGVLLGVWLLFLTLQRNRPEDVGLPSIEEYHGEPTPVLAASDDPASEKEGSRKAVVQVLKNPMVLRLGAVYFFLKPTRYAILLWGPLFVKEKLGTNIGDSALISALFEAAGPLGVLFAGYASDKLFGARRMPICVIFLLLLSTIMFSSEVLTNARSIWMMGTLLFAIGFLLFGPDSVIVATSAVDFGTKEGASTAVGLINGFGSIGAVLGGLLPGFMSQRVVFYIFATFILVAALLLLPKWNAVPATAAKKS